MNINALLSPSDSPSSPAGSSSAAASPPPPKAAPGGKRATSGLSQQLRRSPDPHTTTISSVNTPTSTASASPPTSAFTSPNRGQRAFPRQPAAVGAVPNFRPVQQQQPQAPTSNPSHILNAPPPPFLAHSHAHAHASSQQRPVVAHRVSSTPQMETLAGTTSPPPLPSLRPLTPPAPDLASMQQRHQTVRAHSHNSGLQARAPTDVRSPTLINPSTVTSPPIFRNTSGRSLADLTMADAPASTPPPRPLESTALSDSESTMVSDLLQHLAENSWAYESHVQLIGLLHKGFIAHLDTEAGSNDDGSREPKDFNLLTELRQAREAMDTRFAVGEDMWIDWLSDEMLLAASYEERMAVTELCEKAVDSEPSSVKLWQMWVDWVSTNYAACNDMGGSDQRRWTQDDKEVCRELFTRDMIISVLEKGQAATQWRLDESHVLWNQYAQRIQEALPDPPSSTDVDQLLNMFGERLQTPHIRWEETAQMFWPLVSKYRSGDWEGIMRQVNELSASAKRSSALREEREFGLQRAIESGDKDAIYNAFTEYFEWEKKQARKHKQQGPFDGHIRCALYERALLRFPAYADWWLDYADYMITSATTTISVLPLLKRAINHCPWSGDLWARWILQSDVEGKSRADIEEIKHKATNSGLLDVGGMEELVKVLIQWCSYLRRHAFRPNCSEDDLDTAEVGITMALEDIQQAGTKIYGTNFQGDPLYRLERIHIKFLSEARRFEDARALYESLAKTQKQCAEFWITYYYWELWLWGFDRMGDKHRVETADNGPHRATAIVQQALSQRGLDEPERILTMYLNHFQQHESGEKLRVALVDARAFSKYLAIRRAKEVEAAQAQATTVPVAAVDDNDDASAGEKRKRSEDLTNGHSDKKSKTSDSHTTPAESGEPSAAAQIKRDRENNTVTIKNLPRSTQELDIKKFFRDVGAPLSINILDDKDGQSRTATAEFQTHEDVLAAKTKDGKDWNGNTIRIHGGSQSTLYVANYPPEYDESAIRQLFDSYGEIISVRLPSLKFNNRRRFCYVQFLTSEMAKAAEEAMNDKMLDGNHKLLAKISDPDAKKQRSGAQAEGRELFVKNLDHSTPESDVKKFFEQYGSVVSINLVKLVNGRRTGTAFIVFSNAEEATAALEANNKPLSDRILHVEISSAKGRADPLERARKEDVIIKQGGSSASPEPDDTNGRRGSDISMTSSHQLTQQDDAYKTARERKIAVFDLPDTVNDARIRAAMESHGPITKIQLRREKGGAIVEFANVQDAFNVRQGVDCSALGDGVRTGDVGDLLAKAKKSKADGSSMMSSSMAPPSVSRPGQRGGKRGGLGFKRGGFGGGRGSWEGVEGAKKSNADFREMFVKAKETDAGGEKEEE